VISCLTLCSTCLSAPQEQAPLFSAQPKQLGKVINHELSNYVEKMAKLFGVKGTSIVVVRPGGEVELGAWGIKSEDGEKVTPETVYNIGSCSKAFLAATMGILMDDFQQEKNGTALPSEVNSFTWSTKLKDILPDEWEVQDPWANEKADILDILSHRSGLPRHDGSYSHKDTAEDVIKRMKHLRPAYELRQKFAYNNQVTPS